MKRPERRVAAATAYLAAAMLFGNTPGPVAAADDTSRRTLVEQKVRLVEMLVRSGSAKSAAPDGDPLQAELLEKRRQLLDQAQQALAAGRLAEAERSLDEALARSTRASTTAAHQSRVLADSALDASIQNLEQQVASYRATLAALARGDTAAAVNARTLMGRVDEQTSAAARLAAGGNRAGAHDRLREGYRLLVEGLSRIQAGQTLVMSLKFDTPADEYAYEQRRLHSNELLVRMVLSDMGREGEGLRRQVEPYTADADRLREQAEALWRGNDQAGAIALMERAFGQLTRALQVLGVPAY